MIRIMHPADLDNIRRIANLIGSGKAPWQQNGKTPTLPYNLKEHRFFDTYQTMIMLTNEAENSYKSSGWINANELENSVYQAKGAERPLSLSEPIYLQTKRDLNGNVLNEVGFAAYPDIDMQNYYNVDQCNISLYNRLMNSGEMSSSELKKKQKATLDALLKFEPDALKKLYSKDFHNIDSSIAQYDERYISGHFSEAYDSRYKGIDYHNSQIFYALVNVMIEYRLCAELGIEYNGMDPHLVDFGSDSYSFFDSDFASAIEKYPEVFISLCEDVDIAVNNFLGRDRIFDLEQSLVNHLHSDTHRFDFQEDDILVFPKNKNTVSWETIFKSLRMNSYYTDSFVVIEYQGKNIGLLDAYSNINEADKALKKIDERFAFLDERSPIKFTAYFSKNGQFYSYSGRYDIGKNEGGLLQHIRRYCNEHMNSSQYHDFVKEREGIEGLKSKLDILSDFRNISSTALDYAYGYKTMLHLQSNDNEIRELQEENRQSEYIEHLRERGDLSIVRKSLLASYDYLSLDYRERISREDLRNDTCPGLTLNIARDALNGAYARMQLKNYLPANDIRWSTMSTAEAKELAASYKGKMNLQQQAYFEKNKIPFNANTTYVEANKIIEEGKATEKMLTYASTFMTKESLANLSNKEIYEAGKAYEKLVADRAQECVPKVIYNHAVKCGFVKEGETYTNGQWAKDSRNCEPMEILKAYVERYQLQDVVKSLQETYPNLWPKESQALYALVQNRNEERIIDCKHSLMNQYQEKFLSVRGIDTRDIKTWQDAQYYVCDALYKEGLVSLSDVKLIATDTTIKLPDRLAEGVSGSKSLPSEEKAAVIKEVRTLCNDVRKADRLYKINVSPLEPHNTLMTISRYACYEHLAANNGSFKDVEKSMAEALVCSNFNFSSSDRERIPLVESINGTDKSTISNAQIIAHYIVNTLPDYVGRYTDAMPKVINIVQNAEQSLEKVKAKEALKEQGRQEELSIKNDKSRGSER